MRILIIGGYGVFGSRLVELLADRADLTLIIAGRSLERAEALIACTRAEATLVPAVIDRNGDLAGQFALHTPNLIVDASGPFQNYGSDPYKVVEAAIELGINYLDLADGSDFVRGIAAFDDRAKQNGVYVLAGCQQFSGADRRRGPPPGIGSRTGRDDCRRHCTIALCRVSV